MLTTETQIELVLRSRSGDQEAFGELARAAYPALYGIAYGIAGERTAAEDVVQDALVACWTHLSNLKSPEAFGVWTRKTVRNLALNWLRSRSYRNRLAQRREEIYAADCASPEQQDELTRTEATKRLFDILQELSPCIREAVIIYYMEGRSIEETAAALDISENTVKQRLKRGRDQLRDYLLTRWEKDFDEELRDLVPPGVLRRLMLGLALGAVLPGLARQAAAGGVRLSLHRLYYERWRAADWVPGAGASAVAAGGLVVAALVVFSWLFGASTPKPVPPVPAASSATMAPAAPEPAQQAASVPPDALTPQQPASNPVAPVSEAAVPAGDTITGYVLEPSGIPVAGATVTAYTALYNDNDLTCPYCLKKSLRNGRAFEATTGADGFFSMTPGEAAAEGFLLTAEAADYGFGCAEHIRLGTEGVSLELAPAGRVRGLAVDADTGLPIAQFEARVAVAISGFQYGAIQLDNPWQGFSSADGAFELVTGAYEHVELGVRARGYVPVLTPPVYAKPGNAVENSVVELRRGYSATGLAVDGATGAPLPGVRVTMVRSPSMNLSARTWDFSGMDACSDAEGRFEIEGLADEPHAYLAAYAPGYALGLAEIPKAGGEARIEMFAPGAIRGLVKRSGQPLGRFRLISHLPVGDPRRAYGTSSDTNADGVAVIENLPPGDHTLWFYEPSANRARAKAIVRVEPGAITDIEVDTADFGFFCGIVQAPDRYKELQVGIRMEGYPDNYLYEKPPVFGYFELGIQQPGTYELFVYEKARPRDIIMSQTYELEPGKSKIVTMVVP